MPIFKPGKKAHWNGREMTVSYVLIRKGRLFVHLHEHGDPVPYEHIDMPASELIWPPERLQDRMQTIHASVVPGENVYANDQPGTAAGFHGSQDLASQASPASDSTDDIFNHAAALPGPGNASDDLSADDIFAQASQGAGAAQASAEPASADDIFAQAQAGLPNA